MKLYYPEFSSGEIIQAPTGNGKTINTTILLLKRLLEAQKKEEGKFDFSDKANHAEHQTASYLTNQRIRQTSH